jgi:biotin carboxylase
MKVLILQAGFNEIGVIQSLKKLGCFVISIGNQRGLIGQSYVDEYYCVDYSKKEQVLQFALEHQIDYVCACCNDTAVLTANYVAEKMNLKGYDTYDSSAVICHKHLFKKYAMEHGILTLPAKEFSDAEAAKKWVSQSGEYPLIVKPVDMSGGKGISRCNNLEEAEESIDKALKVSRNGIIVIEPFIEGTQHGFCTFLVNQRVVACCSNDEHSVVNPYRVEVDTFPADHIEKYEELLISQVEQMARDLNLADGIFHLQYIEKDGKIYILEAMRRIIGNMYSVPASKANDFDWDYWQARAGIGLDCSEAPHRVESKGYFAYRALIPPKNGVIQGVVIDKEIAPYVFQKNMFHNVGDTVENYVGETVGMVFLQFGSKEEMNRVMLEQYDGIRVEMEE